MDRQHVETLHLLMGLLKAIARKAAFQGVNHRDFCVGCAILAYNGYEYRVFWGANWMPYPSPGPKICAEINALHKAWDAGFYEIIGIVVAGLPQKDEASGKYPKTLPPCANCRRHMSGWPGISPDTVIITIHRFLDIEEEWTLPKLQEEYKPPLVA